MKNYKRILSCCLAVTASAATAGAGMANSSQDFDTTPPTLAAAPSVNAPRAACPSLRPSFERCLTVYEPSTATNLSRAGDVPTQTAGWGATDIEAAYKLSFRRPSRTLVAVSVAYNAPNLEHDLNVYRLTYGLSPCTVASGCMRILNQRGNLAPLPAPNAGWEIEATLDVSMISAACASCRVLVVEANSPSDANLAATEDTAVRLGAQVVSNSYGEPENGHAMQYAKAYNHPNHVIVVASGDSGFAPASFPAVLPTVTAVGGTELVKASNPRGWSETVWRIGLGIASGSGCSAYVTKPTWQTDRHCGMRTTADVSAVAWNVRMYDTDAGGWLTVGGTSAAAPIIAGIYGLAGNASRLQPGSLYTHAGSFFDVTMGSNDASGKGVACGPDYLCTAVKGYDAPTGLGTPDGIGGF